MGVKRVRPDDEKPMNEMFEKLSPNNKRYRQVDISFVHDFDFDMVSWSLAYFVGEVTLFIYMSFFNNLKRCWTYEG